MLYVIIALLLLSLVLIFKLHTANSIAKTAQQRISDLSDQVNSLSEDLDIIGSRADEIEAQRDILFEKERKHKENLTKLLSSNLTAIPWLAGMMADYLTYDIEVEARKLEWGSNIQRQKKIASVRDIRRQASARIEEAKVATYQLEYLRQLFPDIDEIISTDYSKVELEKNLQDADPSRHFLSDEEWHTLPENERNQLALDRYVESRKKSNWQIGRDYELAVAYEYRQHGYSVDTFGSYMKIEDLGRDLIAKKNDRTLIIQCKYWSEDRTIHEKHIFQLYGTLICYCLDNHISEEKVKGIFVTKTRLSSMAKRVATLLNIEISEGHQMVEFPRIKCNIGRGEFGERTRIYHLPMDDMYDQTKIEKPGEFYAFSVKEAEAAGFRRAYRWHGNG